MRQPTHWMGTPRTAGLLAGTWCSAALILAMHSDATAAPLGTGLLRWLASAGAGPELLPIAVAGLVVLVHGMLIRDAAGNRSHLWADAALSLALVAAGICLWTWSLHYEPFADPFSPSRRLAALAGLGAMLVGAGITVAAAVQPGLVQRAGGATIPPHAPHTPSPSLARHPDR